MDLSGIIFVVLAVAWAVYLIPKALKHHDEVARTRSVDRFSTAMRVLARREPVNHRQARLVVTPPRPADAARILLPSQPSTVSTPQEAVRRTVRPAARRAAARAAARRRRHVLILLLLVDLVVAGLAAFAVLPWWSVAIPAVLTVAYLVLCRTQVRRENEASWTRDLEDAPAATDEATGEIAPRRAIRVDAAYGTPSTRNDQGVEEVSPDEDTVTLPAHVVAAVATASSAEDAELIAARAQDTVAVSVPTVDGGSLWDPLPVTLPTYVGKPRASRTVRTIDLGEPGAWTSGRSEADSKLVEEAAAQEQDAGEAEEQRAVGS